MVAFGPWGVHLRGHFSRGEGGGPATVLQPRLPSQGLHGLLSPIRARLAIVCPIGPLCCSPFLPGPGLEVWASCFWGSGGRAGPPGGAEFLDVLGAESAEEDFWFYESAPKAPEKILIGRRPGRKFGPVF